VNCSKDLVMDYVLGEATPAARLEFEAHVKTCRDCAAERDRLDVTRAALTALPREEMPRRIAFVSDKVFEPTWWQRLWPSSQWTFAAAGVLSAAIVFHAVWGQKALATDPALVRREVAAGIDAELQMRMPALVARATALAEARHSEESARLVRTALNAASQRYELERRAERLTMEANFELMKKQMNRILLASRDAVDVGGQE